MAKGRLLSPAYDAQIRESLSEGTRERNKRTETTERPQRRPSVFRPLVAITDSQTTGTVLVPEFGLVTLCEYDVATETREQTKQIDAANISGETIEPDTPVLLIPVDGHFAMLPACEPMENRPTPPWDQS